MLSCCSDGNVFSTPIIADRRDVLAHLGQEAELHPGVRLDQIDQVLCPQRPEHIIDISPDETVLQDGPAVFCRQGRISQVHDQQGLETDRLTLQDLFCLVNISPLIRRHQIRHGLDLGMIPIPTSAHFRLSHLLVCRSGVR